MSVIRLSNAILLQHSTGNPAQMTLAIFLFLKETASANRVILYAGWGRGLTLMDAVGFAAITAGARARRGSARTWLGLRLWLWLCRHTYVQCSSL